jgi:hypothetical protein
MGGIAMNKITEYRIVEETFGSGDRSYGLSVVNLGNDGEITKISPPFLWFSVGVSQPRSEAIAATKERLSSIADALNKPIMDWKTQAPVVINDGDD